METVPSRMRDAVGTPVSAAARPALPKPLSALPSPGVVRQKFLHAHPCPRDLNVSRVARLLEHDNHAMRASLREFLCNPAFKPRYDIDLRDERTLALSRLRALTSIPGRFISVRDFIENPLRVFAAHELIGLADGSLATKLTVQFNLAGGTVLKLGTKRHHGALLDDIDALRAVGCFALTELNYGNNAVQMETTAVYDKRNAEFVINTPSVGAQKYWITNSAVDAHFAVVFAQLFVSDVARGVHAFIVPIRDRATHAAKPGVFIADMGHKIGCNGVDNGRLAFHNVRVPRTALLNRFSDVGADGQFTTTTQGKRALFIKVADQLLSGRLCISSMMIGTAKLACVIATRYAMSRLAVGPSGASDMPLLALQFQQRSLAPLVARVFACAIALDYCKDRYVALQGKSDDEWREAIVLCCAIKPMVTWTAEDVVSTLRERCGGQGYLSENRFGHLIGFAHAGITAEGDDAVLMQKVAKELLVLVKQRRVSIPRTTARGRPDVTSLDGLHALLATREARLVVQLAGKMKTAGNIYDTWMQKESALVQETALAFVEVTAFECMAKAARGDRWLGELLQLYAAECVRRDLGWFLAAGVIAPAAKGTDVEKEVERLCGVIGPVLPHLVDAFGIPDGLLGAPIAGDWTKANALPAPFAKM